MNAAQIHVQQGLGPIARALVAGSVIAVTKTRVGWTIVIEARQGGAITLIVSREREAAARVCAQARPGEFVIAEAHLVPKGGGCAIEVAHLMSDRETYLPRVRREDAVSRKEQPTHVEQRETEQIAISF